VTASHQAIRQAEGRSSTTAQGDRDVLHLPPRDRQGSGRRHPPRESVRQDGARRSHRPPRAEEPVRSSCASLPSRRRAPRAHHAGCPRLIRASAAVAGSGIGRPQPRSDTFPLLEPSPKGETRRRRWSRGPAAASVIRIGNRLLMPQLPAGVTLSRLPVNAEGAAVKTLQCRLRAG